MYDIQIINYFVWFRVGSTPSLLVDVYLFNYNLYDIQNNIIKSMRFFVCGSVLIYHILTLNFPLYGHFLLPLPYSNLSSRKSDNTSRLRTLYLPSSFFQIPSSQSLTSSKFLQSRFNYPSRTRVQRIISSGLSNPYQNFIIRTTRLYDRPWQNPFRTGVSYVSTYVCQP